MTPFTHKNLKEIDSSAGAMAPELRDPLRPQATSTQSTSASA